VEARLLFPVYVIHAVRKTLTTFLSPSQLLHKHEYETPLACTKYATDAMWWEYPLDVIHKIPPDRLKESAAGVLNLLSEYFPFTVPHSAD
jgi:hypothetical protein